METGQVHGFRVKIQGGKAANRVCRAGKMGVLFYHVTFLEPKDPDHNNYVPSMCT